MAVTPWLIGTSLGLFAWASSRRRKLGVGPTIPLPHPLNALPPELWHKITNFLDPASCASLALASRMLLYLLGTQHWLRLNTPEFKADKIRFLNYLNPHLPRHFLCTQCALFHKHRPARWGSKEQEMYWRWTRDPMTGEQVLHGGSGYTWLVYPFLYLPWANVQSAARFLRYGPDFGNPLPDFDQGSTLTSYPNGHEALKNWRYTMDSAICEGHFILCVEAVKDIPWAENVPSDLESELACDRTPNCLHFELELAKMLACASRHIVRSARLGLKSVELCHFCTQLRRCHTCPAEYQISIETRDENSSEGGTEPACNLRVRLSRWTDCGNGWDADHRFWKCYRETFMKYRLRDPHAFDLGGLASARTRFSKAKGRYIPDTDVETLAVFHRSEIRQLPSCIDESV
jgi:hypothetical protein